MIVGTIIDPVHLGARVRVGPGSIIGGVGDHRDVDKWPFGVCIGDRTEIREHVVVHRGMSRETHIGKECLLMHGAHVSHDCIVGDRVTMAMHATLGGHCIIGDDVNIGMGAMIHQWVVVGAKAMIGMGAVVVDDVPPGVVVVGCPARIIGPNKKFPEYPEGFGSAFAEFKASRSGRRERAKWLSAATL